MNKTLQDFKDEVAKENGYASFEHFDAASTFSYDHRTPEIIDAICNRYAAYREKEAFTQGAEAQKIICAEHAALKAEFYGEGPIKFYKGYIVDKKSILNAPTAQPKTDTNG